MAHEPDDEHGYDLDPDDDLDSDDEDDDEDSLVSPFRSRPPIPTDVALALLRDGEIEVLGRMPYSSNATFLVDICHEGLPAQAIYKPHRGERPLWDFPSGLFKREAAAFDLAEHLGWHFVPPTVVRDGPLGEGSLQLFVPAHFEQHYFTLREDDAHLETMQRLCVFDLIANNTDRKSGHVLLGEDGGIWAIDNGLSFHAEFKLRTVIWDFAGDPIPAAIREDVERLLDEGLPGTFAVLLDAFERDAVLTRARAIVREGRFPVDHSGRRYPWPLV
jgi:uncharacterized repeat protein (TIGR03843 family)